MTYLSKSVLMSAFIVLAVLGSFATWLILRGNAQQQEANVVSVISELARLDAITYLDSGRINLIALCCCAPSVKKEVPLFDNLKNKPCLEKILREPECSTPLPNDVRSGHSLEFQLEDGDLSDTRRYAIAYNNHILNYLAENNFGGCFDMT